MTALEKLPAGIRRSRRNLIKVGRDSRDSGFGEVDNPEASSRAKQ